MDGDRIVAGPERRRVDDHLRQVGSLLGEGTTALGRAGVAGAKQALRGMVEGGLYAGGAAESDAALQNEPLTAEKPWHWMSD